ncbi:hypothetical protein [Streptomyces sp. HUAS ZL42]|uniref:hypothetical protein n=1 Tax=Streptomyces sp. HUAS ZL42 TaxID=3231715 RepID=UPI00345EAABC
MIAEVERIATELAAPGIDAETAGSRPEDKPGGLRNFPIFGGRGFIQFLAVPRHECVYVCNIVWNGCVIGPAAAAFAVVRTRAARS